MKRDSTIKLVKDAYGKIAKGQNGCGCGCKPDTKEFARSVGYSEEELKVIPEDANLALSCGNPLAFAGLKEGDIVLDLGAGAGFDCFLAASKVGPKGKVIGVDMTPEMISKARENAEKNGVKNVEFRLGEIENLPLSDSSVNIVISNCVINLSADKPKVFREIYRVLRPGGRISISDMALLKALPEKIQKSMEAYIGCVAGALLVDDYRKFVEASGMKNVRVTVKGSSSCIDPDTADPVGRALLDVLGRGESLNDYVVSVYVEGSK